MLTSIFQAKKNHFLTSFIVYLFHMATKKFIVLIITYFQHLPTIFIISLKTLFKGVIKINGAILLPSHVA